MFEPFWNDLVKFLSNTLFELAVWRLIAAGVILIVTLIVRKLFVSFIISLLKKFTQKTKSHLDDKLLDAIDRPARLVLIAVGLLFAFKVLGFTTNETSFVGHLIRTLLITAIFWALYRGADILVHMFERFVKKTESALDNLLVPFASKGAKVIIVIVAVSVIAKEWRYDIGTLLAGLGLGGLAFALAAKETLSNFFGGLTIMVDKPFAVGHWIVTPHVEGVVEEIGFRSTRVRTFAQALVTVPNSDLANTPITNWSHMGKRRIQFTLSLDHHAKPEQLEECLQRFRRMLSDNPEVHPQTILVNFDEFGPQALNIYFYFFTVTTSYEKYQAVKEEVNLQIMHILEELGLKLAFQTTTVMIKNEE